MQKITSLLIGAMGGEGGGVLTSWIVEAARIKGLGVQATSVPGVAQRTGATTYYIELGEKNEAGKSPIFSLYPIAGNLDIMLSSELLETARALSRGLITSEKTQVITSTQRTYSTPERSTANDSRLDPEELTEVIKGNCKTLDLWDMQEIASQMQTPISSVMLGFLAKSQILPISKKEFEEVIIRSGKAKEKNLAAFNSAYGLGDSHISEHQAIEKKQVFTPDGINQFTSANHEILSMAYQNLMHYQDRSYADLLFSRLFFCKDDPEICESLAKELSHLMAYEDMFRVAQLKTEFSRFQKIKSDHKIEKGDIYEIVDILKPGMQEIVDVLPSFIGQKLMDRAARKGGFQKWGGGMNLKTSSVSGFFALWVLTKFKPWRRKTYRFKETQKQIDQWLEYIQQAFNKDRRLALEVIKFGELIKGYGETQAKGRSRFDYMLKERLHPIIEENRSSEDAALEMGKLRLEFLNKPDKTSLA